MHNLTGVETQIIDTVTLILICLMTQSNKFDLFC